MWISRFSLKHDEAARKRLFDLYAWHKAVWSCFPGEPEASRDFLFRVTETQRGFVCQMVSRRQPVPPSFTGCAWESKEIPEKFFAHKRYQFDLLANPTRAVLPQGEGKVNGRRGKRVGILDQEGLRSWFLRKASEGGFSLLPDVPLQIDPPRYLSFRKGSREGTHAGVRFRGAIAVNTPEMFKQRFAEGFGSAKGFGFGLMMLQPVFN